MSSSFSLFCLQGAGLKAGDYVVSVGSLDVRWDKCDQVQDMIKVVEDKFMLRVIKPMDTDCSTSKVRINLIF